MNYSLLQKALLGNATFSTACALILFTFTNALSDWYGGMPNSLLLALGVSLLSFAGVLIWVAMKSPVQLNLAQLITYADWAWVIGTPIVIAAFYQHMTESGILLMVLVAIMVGSCALAQRKGLKIELSV